ncbi:MAG: UDP-N-acetylglucosamine 1-carboxyvinyltransferase, partial [Bdellovibrionales bacterium]|nr:UDP-N-acetylglucosamine 1-carboxyvinyltransferase [Bdellovibrionales bacterium]
NAAEIELRFPSVGATHQILMAAALTPGTTTLTNAACEPEIETVAEFINSMGGDIEGAGSPCIVIHGKSQLGGGAITLPGDRIEAATYLLAAAATGGQIELRQISADHFGNFLVVLDEMGVVLDVFEGGLTVQAPRKLKAIDVATGPFPEFATDMQPLLMAALTTAEGVSRVEENIYEGRFGHVAELCRLGADIQVNQRTATVKGVPSLSGAPVETHDIRAGAALVIAALSAEGVSAIYEPQHLWRGYQNIVGNLCSLGAVIGRRISDPEDFILSGC